MQAHFEYHDLGKFHIGFGNLLKRGSRDNTPHSTKLSCCKTLKIKRESRTHVVQYLSPPCHSNRREVLAAAGIIHIQMSTLQHPIYYCALLLFSSSMWLNVVIDTSSVRLTWNSANSFYLPAKILNRTLFPWSIPLLVFHSYHVTCSYQLTF
jgi:hypothetical protein